MPPSPSIAMPATGSIGAAGQVFAALMPVRIGDQLAVAKATTRLQMRQWRRRR